MLDVSPRLTVKDFLWYGLAWGFWFIISALALFMILYLRNTLNFLWPFFGDGNQWRWLLRPIDRFGIVFLGLVWLAYVIFCEHYYRESITMLRIKREGLNVVNPIPEPRTDKFSRWLRRLGIDILIDRFLRSLVAPAIILTVCWVLQQTVPFLLQTFNWGIFG